MLSTVFGLDVRAGQPLPALERSRTAATGRTLDVRIHDDAAELSWPAGARTICSRRHRDGSQGFRIDADPRAGYLIWGDGRGSFVISADGRRLRCAPAGCARAQWERFLLGQVLPFAALLAGLEIFHASAVVLEGRTVAFVGPSGAGKTSVALAACRHGAGFLADDVLALEPSERALMAQPGTPLAGVDHREARRLAHAGRAVEHEVIGADARERLIVIAGADAPAPLGALFFLDRRREGAGGPVFEPAADARMLLASTFNFVLDTPQRMRGLLEVCALAARRRVERILIPPSVDAGALAGAVVARLNGSA